MKQKNIFFAFVSLNWKQQEVGKKEGGVNIIDMKDNELPLELKPVETLERARPHARSLYEWIR